MQPHETDLLAGEVCNRCQKQPELRSRCAYISTSAATRTRASGDNDRSTLEPAGPTVDEVVKAADDRKAQNDCIDHAQDQEPGPFASKVTAAISAKLGLPCQTEQCPIPLLDAPLFGTFDLKQSASSTAEQTNSILPPRKNADHLLKLYWQSLESIEPTLDQDAFYRSYQTIYMGGDLTCDERVFMSTLCVVFAFGTQLQDNLPLANREEAGRLYFLRAWSLLKPDKIIWESGSIELVQCLLLMSRFLQCTTNQHQTWMVLGFAVRLAQSLGLHVSSDATSNDRGLSGWSKRELWHQCAYLDRSLAWSLGRPLLVPLESVPSAGRSPPSSELLRNTSASLWKLDRITSHILLAQTTARGKFAEVYGVSSSTTKADMNTATHFEDCLAKLNASFESVQQTFSEAESKRRTLFRVRLAHARILLFRPMLARLCFPQFSPGNAPLNSSASLESRVLQDCASLCMESTERLLSLVCSTCGYGADGGTLPWWYRVFYLFVASQHLLAATLRPDLFGSMVLESWTTAMSTLSAHEHLSPAIKRCVSSFQKMSQKVTNSFQTETDIPTQPDYLPDFDVQAFFQQSGFEMQDLYFENNDIAWPNGSTDWSV
ncbi:MAG: hypothetical protein M1828_001135 [Chrysothrix sp. TS-e1954]|nr:MAG: hypothetical protein M1828_001135 [Chrysothrix sp. TS-e1954]